MSDKLSVFLILPEYLDNLIDEMLTEIRHYERMTALQKKANTHKKILPFVTEYRPSVLKLSKRHYGTMAKEYMQ